MMDNSAFNKDITNPATKHMRQYNSESTISSMEDSFNSTEFKEIVESLVMSKFGTRYNTQILKSISRESQRQSASSSSGNNFENAESSCRVNISKKKSYSNINISNMSELASNLSLSATFGTKSVDDALPFLDTRSSVNNFENTENSSKMNISKKKSHSNISISNISECVSNVSSGTMFDAKSFDDGQSCLETRTRGTNFESTETRYKRNISTISDSTVNTSDISELISNVSSFGVKDVDDELRYSDTCTSSTSLETENNILSLRENSSESDELESVSTITMVGGSNFSLEVLNIKKLILYHTREQILKAIHYHEMSNSKLTLRRERLEAEKLLLITDARLNSVFYQTEESTSDEDINPFCSGTLLISNMRLFPEQFCDQHFVCLITFDTKVFVTEISKMKSNGVIYFAKKITISGLQFNFKLRLKIYSASPKNLKKSIRSQIVCSYRDDRFEDGVPFRTSIFSLWGEADIELRHLSEGRNLELKMDSGLFTSCISSQAVIDMNMSGFMNVSKTSDKYPLWDRQFCCFRKGILSFHNYPPNEGDQLTPTGVLNLEICELILPSRENCSRKHSICLKNANDGVLMSFDTQDEFECWSKYLSIALLHIRTWNKC